LAGDSNTLTDWIEIPTISTTKCSECHREITPGLALRSKSTRSIKHLNCIKDHDMKVIKHLRNRQMDSNLTESFNREFIQKPGRIELKCFISGHLTGCQRCVFNNSCEIKLISQSCVCEACMSQMREKELISLDLYHDAFLKKAKFTSRQY